MTLGGTKFGPGTVSVPAATSFHSLHFISPSGLPSHPRLSTVSSSDRGSISSSSAHSIEVVLDGRGRRICFRRSPEGGLLSSLFARTRFEAMLLYGGSTKLCSSPCCQRQCCIEVDASGRFRATVLYGDRQRECVIPHSCCSSQVCSQPYAGRSLTMASLPLVLARSWCARKVCSEPREVQFWTRPVLFLVEQNRCSRSNVKIEVGPLHPGEEQALRFPGTVVWRVCARFSTS